jgi:hypothetical protein
MPLRLLAIAVLLICGAFFANAAQDSILLGVLEDVPGHYVGESYSRAVRVVFAKRGDVCQPFPSECRDQGCLKSISASYPEKVQWTISFDGRSLGQLTARTRKEFEFYSDIGFQDVVSGGTVPSVGERSDKYAGFLGSPVYRPLIADSQSNSTDPDHWKPGQLSPAAIAAVRREFRKKFPRVTNCRTPDENIAKPWAYADENMKLLKVYSSAKNWSVVQIALQPYRCDGPEDHEFLDQWFAVSPEREVGILDEGMWLVDAGDYDNDGKSELVFSISRYNRGGYEIFSNDFGQHATFEFGYH